MILIWTNQSDSTANLVQRRLASRAIPFCRLNTDTSLLYTSRLTFGSEGTTIKDSSGRQVVDLDAVTAIWYRRPDLPPHPLGCSPQVGEFLTAEYLAYFDLLASVLEDRLWVSPPSALRAARYKCSQLSIAQRLGFRVPATVVTNDLDAALAFYHSQAGSIVGKTLALGGLHYGHEGAMICTTVVTEADLRARPRDFALCPTLLQERIEKAFELRVTLIGDDVFAAGIDSQSDLGRSVDWRRPTPRRAEWASFQLPSEVADGCRRLLRHYGLNFGAFDFAVTPQGEYVLFELNPNGQWAWLELQTGALMVDSLIALLTRAPSR